MPSEASPAIEAVQQTGWHCRRGRPGPDRPAGRVVEPETVVATTGRLELADSEQHAEGRRSVELNDSVVSEAAIEPAVAVEPDENALRAGRRESENHRLAVGLDGGRARLEGRVVSSLRRARLRLLRNPRVQKLRIGVGVQILKEAERVAEGIPELAPPDDARLAGDLRNLDALFDERPARGRDVRNAEAHSARPARWHPSRELVPHASHHLVFLKVLVQNEVRRPTEELSVEAERLCHIGDAHDERHALDW